MSLNTKSFTSSTITANSSGIETLAVGPLTLLLAKIKITPSSDGNWYAEIYYDSACTGVIAYRTPVSSSVYYDPKMKNFDDTFEEAGGGRGLPYVDSAGSGNVYIKIYNQSATDRTFTIVLDYVGLVSEKNGKYGLGTDDPQALFHVVGGGILVGSPTGGDKGAGTINAVAVYDDNVLLTDFVFEKDYEVLSIDGMEAFYSKYKHLPTISGRKEWEKGKFSLGRIVNEIWETVEVQAIYIAQLNRRIRELECRLAR